MNAPIPLGPVDLAIAAILVVAAGLLSLLLRVGMERRLAIAAVRTTVQLSLIGYVLDRIFAIDRAILVVGLVSVMIAAAGREAVRSSARVFKGIYPSAWTTLLCTGIATTAVVTQMVIGVDRWFEPQYVIPLLGMILGNSLTGISLCLDHLLSAVDERRAVIEMELSHGATRWEAMRQPIADAVRRGMIPMINAMTVAGLVSLPGMVSGQILAGADPFIAVRYQIMIMFTLAGSTSIGCVLIALLVYRRVTNDRHQLRAERVTARKRQR